MDWENGRIERTTRGEAGAMLPVSIGFEYLKTVQKRIVKKVGGRSLRLRNVGWNRAGGGAEGRRLGQPWRGWWSKLL